MGNNKIHKSVRLSHEIYDLVSGYKEATGTNLSIAVEQLIIKGLENVQTSKNIYEKQHNDTLKFVKMLKNLEERIIYLQMTNLRIAGGTKAVIKANAIKSKSMTIEEADSYEKTGILNVMNSIKDRDAEE